MLPSQKGLLTAKVSVIYHMAFINIAGCSKTVLLEDRRRSNQVLPAKPSFCFDNGALQ